MNFIRWQKPLQCFFNCHFSFGWLILVGNFKSRQYHYSSNHPSPTNWVIRCKIWISTLFSLPKTQNSLWNWFTDLRRANLRVKVEKCRESLLLGKISRSSKHNYRETSSFRQVFKIPPKWITPRSINSFLNRPHTWCHLLLQEMICIYTSQYNQFHHS